MELVRDMGIKNSPWLEEIGVPKPDSLAERMEEGTTDPHPMGLPSLAAAAARVAAQDMAAQTPKKGAPKGAPKETPQRTVGRPQRKVNMESGRVVSPPKATTRASNEEDIQMINGRIQVVEIIGEEDVDVTSTKFKGVDPEIVAKARQANH
ncbi:unnamed protein product [Calypogeia fissa]